MKYCALIILIIISLLASSCLKCYDCTTYRTRAWHIDTVFTAGHYRYDTLGGEISESSYFQMCGHPASYRYDSFSAPILFHDDSFTMCKLRTK